MSKNKLMMGGIIVVAVVAIAYFAFVYPPTNGDDATGTIGAAKKYRTDQIKDSDVVLEGDQQGAEPAEAPAPITPLTSSPTALS